MAVCMNTFSFTHPPTPLLKMHPTVQTLTNTQGRTNGDARVLICTIFKKPPGYTDEDYENMEKKHSAEARDDQHPIPYESRKSYLGRYLPTSNSYIIARPFSGVTPPNIKDAFLKDMQVYKQRNLIIEELRVQASRARDGVYTYGAWMTDLIQYLDVDTLSPLKPICTPKKILKYVDELDIQQAYFEYVCKMDEQVCNEVLRLCLPGHRIKTVGTFPIVYHEKHLRSMECFYTLQTGNEVDFLDVVSTLVEQSDRRIGVICLAFGHGPKYDHVTNADAIVDVHAVSQRYFKEIVTAEGIKETPQYYTIQKAKQSEQTFSQDNSNLDVLSMLRHRTLGTMRKGILTVAAYTQFYPISYLDEKEQRVRGLDVDIMEAFAKAANLVISWVHIDRFDKIWDEPAHDRADVSIGGIANSMSRQRRETEWSIPYFYVDRALIFNLRNPVTNFPDGMQNQNFEAGSMLGTKHSIGWDDAKLQLTRIGKADLLTEGTTDQEDMKRLLNGEVIAVMRGSLVAYALQKKHPGLGVLVWKASSVLLPTDGEVFAYPTRSGSGVAMALSVFLAHIIATKEINQFTKKHNLLPS